MPSLVSGDTKQDIINEEDRKMIQETLMCNDCKLPLFLFVVKVVEGGKMYHAVICNRCGKEVFTMSQDNLDIYERKLID